ncbi:restriction endonuclease subunit S [Xanthomonas euvesicatoria pv. alangii]|nr:restriction endonuclease subunit S [Xanthomonas euvesicatoria]MBV6667811.1 restriction endonuclease subunit S [Xanthomonas euvesicatoria pv. alangii]
MSEHTFAARPLRDAVVEQMGGGTPSRQVPSYWKGDIPWASVKDFPERPGIISGTQEYISIAGLNASASNLIPARIPLVCTRMAVGRSAMSSFAMAINQDVRALFPAADVSSAYLLRLLEFVRPKAEAQAVGSTVKGIRIQDYLGIEVPLADAPQQSKIAEILDTLDTAIHETEALIAKLKAVKQGLLHDLLTRGIDANGELRPPQSEAPHLYWRSSLGWIPKEWEVRLLDEVAVRGSGHTPSKSVSSYWNGDIKWVSLADTHRLDDIYISETDKTITALGIANSSAVLHPAGTVILSRDAGVGKSAVLALDMAVSQHFMAWRCGDRLKGLFLYFYLQREKPKFEAISVGSTIKTIGLPFFRNYKIALPSWREQDQIVECLMSMEMKQADSFTEFSKLKKLKSGLMDDLLTGRVRVTPLLDAATA